MTGIRGIRRWRRLRALAFAVYALFLVTAQFEHHDLACHFKTPQHCTSCNLSPLGSTPSTPIGLQACILADAGSLLAIDAVSADAELIASWSGRSPPILL